jgi:hypothetical protein
MIQRLACTLLTSDGPSENNEVTSGWPTIRPELCGSLLATPSAIVSRLLQHPNSAPRHRVLQQHLQEQSQLVQRPDCNAGVLQSAEEKEDCIA